MNIFKFIINPDDFGQSVENLFYLSFLIRDGKCAFQTDEDTGEPTISEWLSYGSNCMELIASLAAVLCEQPTHQDYDEGLVKHQLVMEFDMNTWKVTFTPYHSPLSLRFSCRHEDCPWLIRLYS